MRAQTFALALTRGPARRLHRRGLGAIADAMPWRSLDPAPYPAPLLAAARESWTLAAFNEYATAIAMAQLLEALVRARVPLDLWSVASGFAADEILHVELCARLAERLGGAVAIDYRLDDVVPPARGPALQVATDLVVKLCCVGEVFSVAMLRGCARAAAHPLTRAVLTRIADDEALHGTFGWMYLDWLAPKLTERVRRRLGRLAAATIREYEPIWQQRGLGPEPRDAETRTPEGYLVRHVHELGWLEAGDYGRLAERTVRSKIIGPLGRRGIPVPYPG